METNRHLVLHWNLGIYTDLISANVLTEERASGSVAFCMGACTALGSVCTGCL